MLGFAYWLTLVGLGPVPAGLGLGLLGDSYGRHEIYGIELVILIVAMVGVFTRYEL
jgi:hypothetical protein